MALGPTQLVEDKVARNLEQPGRELRPRHVAAGAFPDADENLLRDIFDLGIAAQHPRDCSDHERLMACDQFLKCGRISAPDQTHQPYVLRIFIRTARLLCGFARHRSDLNM